MAKDATPAWFSRLDQLPPYHTVRVPEENAKEVLVEILTKWYDPATATEIRERWNELNRFRSRVRQDLAAREWTQAPGHQLVEYFAGHASILGAIALCIPQHYKTVLPPGMSQFVFNHLLLALGESQTPDDPDYCLKLSLVIREAAPHVHREIDRRLKLHLGSTVGTILFAQALRSEGPIDIPTDDFTGVALDRLRRSTFKMADSRIEKVFKRPSSVEDRLSEGERKKILSMELSGQIWQTIIKKWGTYEALDALARSLDGEMNIVAQAVVDDIDNEVRRIFPAAAASYESKGNKATGEKRRRNFVNETAIDQGEDVGDNDSKETKSIKIRIREITRERHKDEQDERNRLFTLQQLRKHQPRFLATHPEHADGILLWLYDGPQTDTQLAIERGCSVQTLMNRKKNAVKAFRKYMKIQGDY